MPIAALSATEDNLHTPMIRYL